MPAQPKTLSSPRPPLRRRSRPNLARHARKCAICNHPKREEIEDNFLRWDEPLQIYEEYDLPSISSLYRHAEAIGLLARRRRNLRGVAERLLENVNDANVSGSTVLRAMRIFAHITEDGQWIEPPKESLVTHIHKFEQPAPASSDSNNPEPVSPARALKGSVENKSLSDSQEKLLIGNESVSRGEPND